MPTLEIREGAINLLMAVYKKEFASMGGYLTDGSKPNLSRVEHFIQSVGSYEDSIFQKRAQLHKRQAERIKREKAQVKRGDDAEPQVQPDSLVPVTRFHGSRLASAPGPSPYQQRGPGSRMDNGISVKKESDVGKATTSLSVLDIRSKKFTISNRKETYNRAQKVARYSSEATVGAAIVKAENSLEAEIEENTEELKTKLKELLHEKSDLFNCDNLEDDKVLRYAEGLCWIMHYYYEGVCSWQWFYPYHYAPFASDLKGLDKLEISFELGAPFKPFNQLMGVFPAASSHALPVHYRKLMTDPNSPIIDFYPTDFEVDMNGKRFAWQGIAKLPFIDEGRLLAEIQKIEHALTEEEARRNSVMYDMLFVSVSHPLSPYIFSLVDSCKHLSDEERKQIKERLDAMESGGMNGYLSLCSGDPCPSIIRSPVMGMEDINSNQVICAIYRLPDVHRHIARPPAGVIFPEKIVTAGDLQPPPALWHEDNGKKPWENSRQNPPGTISGQQLGEAAHRLVLNSLQFRNMHITSTSSRDYMDVDTRPHLPNGTSHMNRHHHMRPPRLRAAARPPPLTTDTSSSAQHSYGRSPRPRSSTRNYIPPSVSLSGPRGGYNNNGNGVDRSYGGTDHAGRWVPVASQRPAVAASHTQQPRPPAPSE